MVAKNIYGRSREKREKVPPVRSCRVASAFTVETIKRKIFYKVKITTNNGMAIRRDGRRAKVGFKSRNKSFLGGGVTGGKVNGTEV
jgi:hypothetical protein